MFTGYSAFHDKDNDGGGGVGDTTQLIKMTSCDPVAQNVSQNFSGKDFTGMHFQCIDFTDSTFVGATLVGAHFNNIVMVNTNFAGANLTGATFTHYLGDTPGMNMDEANFTGADLTHTTFQIKIQDDDDQEPSDDPGVGALFYMTNANFADANFSNATFTNNLWGANPGIFVMTNANFAGADFTHTIFERRHNGNATMCSMDGTVFVNAHFNHALRYYDWHGMADFSGADFSNADMFQYNGDVGQGNYTGVDFRHAIGQSNLLRTEVYFSAGSVLDHTNWTGQVVDYVGTNPLVEASVSFLNVSAVGSDWSNVTVKRSWLASGQWDHANFRDMELGCQLTERPPFVCLSNVFHASICNADFSGASLETMDFTLSNLTGSVFRNATLTDVNFTRVDLTNVDFTGANVTAKSVSNAIWDNTTCPDGSNSDDKPNGCVSMLPRAPTPSPTPAPTPSPTPICANCPANFTGCYTSTNSCLPCNTTECQNLCEHDFYGTWCMK